MKKLVLTSVCTLAVASGAFAQGAITWASISAGFATSVTNSTQTSVLGVGGGGATGQGGSSATGVTGNGYYYELLFTTYSGSTAPQPTTVSQLATWTDTGLEATNGTTGGRLAPIAPLADYNITGFSDATATPNGTNSIMLVGWSANLGSTYALALAALQNGTYLTLGAPSFFGESTPGYIQGFANGTSPGASPFGNGGLTGAGRPIYNSATGGGTPIQMYILPVPEPSTIAMAAFGGLSLLALRRRK
jgi:hypothetical protein